MRETVFHLHSSIPIVRDASFRQMHTIHDRLVTAHFQILILEHC